MRLEHDDEVEEAAAKTTKPVTRSDFEDLEEAERRLKTALEKRLRESNIARRWAAGLRQLTFIEHAKRMLGAVSNCRSFEMEE